MFPDETHYFKLPRNKPRSIVPIQQDEEPDRETSVELLISTLPVATVAPGITPVGSSPPTPPPDDGHWRYVTTIFVGRSCLLTDDDPLLVITTLSDSPLHDDVVEPAEYVPTDAVTEAPGYEEL